MQAIKTLMGKPATRWYISLPPKRGTSWRLRVSPPDHEAHFYSFLPLPRPKCLPHKKKFLGPLPTVFSSANPGNPLPAPPAKTSHASKSSLQYFSIRNTVHETQVNFSFSSHYDLQVILQGIRSQHIPQMSNVYPSEDPFCLFPHFYRVISRHTTETPFGDQKPLIGTNGKSVAATNRHLTACNRGNQSRIHQKPDVTNSRNQLSRYSPETLLRAPQEVFTATPKTRYGCKDPGNLLRNFQKQVTEPPPPTHRNSLSEARSDDPQGSQKGLPTAKLANYISPQMATEAYRVVKVACINWAYQQNSGYASTSSAQREIFRGAPQSTRAIMKGTPTDRRSVGG